MSKSKARRSGDKGSKPRGSLSQFGLFDMPDLDKMGDLDGGSDMDDDDDLEAELNALIGGPAKPKAPQPSRTSATSRSGKPGVGENLDEMVAKSMRDETTHTDEEDDDYDDPSLLAELGELTGEAEVDTQEEHVVIEATSTREESEGAEATQADLIPLLRDRLNIYIEAEQVATRNNESSKARRYKRGVDKLRSLLNQVEKGVAIDKEEIPVQISVPKPAAPGPPATSDNVTENLVGSSDPTPVSSVPDSTPEPSPAGPDGKKEEIMNLLKSRRDEYKAAAVQAKRNNDIPTALAHIKIIKQFEVILEGVEKGLAVDLNSMPPPPPQTTVPETSEPKMSPPRTTPVQTEDKAPSTIQLDVSPDVSGGEMTVKEALESRLAKYLEQEENAKKEGNSSKVRRMGRIVKQYKEALVLYNSGRPVPYDELPTPPGFPPIPVEAGSAKGPSVTPATHQQDVAPTVQKPQQPEPVPQPQQVQPQPQPQRVAPAPPPSVSPSSAKSGAQSRSEKQTLVLLNRQKEYKQAALKALEAKDREKAKHYLKLAKGFDSLIEASTSGLPVDMQTLPPPLDSKSPDSEGFEVIRIADCIEGSDSEIFHRLLTDLQSQLKMCMETLNHFKAIGDVANANRFENLAIDTKRDLNTVRGAHITSSSVPKFHYEQRTFSIVRCNVDLNDNELELNIIKGINYNVPNPKEIDTYIKFDFPYPNDEVKSDKTSTVYNTNNPEYGAKFIVPIQRSSRPFLRLFKRHSVKLHIWSKGGFLRSDQLVGTVQVKLQPLESVCTIHDAFDLMDGRKALGGKLEVKIRVRNPMINKQVERINEKWLVID